MMGQLVLATGEWLSVGTIRLILGYSRPFVERTMLKLYWEPPKGFTLMRMHKAEADDWFYTVRRKE